MTNAPDYDPSKPPHCSQEHSGSGDNVARDKKEQQNDFKAPVGIGGGQGNTNVSGNAQVAGVIIINPTYNYNSDKPEIPLSVNSTPHTVSNPPTKPNELYYVERPPLEQVCFNEIVKDGALIRLRASQKMGKTMLMNRVLNFAEGECGYQTAYLDLEEPEASTISNLSLLLQYFCQEVAHELDLPPRIKEQWDSTSSEPDNLKCRRYFEQNILKNVETALVLGLDNVDRLFCEPFQSVAADFFSMLRSWHNRRTRKKAWKKFRMIIVYSTEDIPSLGLYQSPFNVGLEQTLSGFNSEQIQGLAQGYNYDLSQDEAQGLITELDGHPYLVHQLFRALSNSPDLSLEYILNKASTDEGIYHQHFESYWKYLQGKPELAQVLQEIVLSPSPLLIPPQMLYELERLGLIKKVGDEVTLKCDLYRTYFSHHVKVLEHLAKEKKDGHHE